MIGSSRSDSAGTGGTGSGGQLSVTADSGGLVTLQAALNATAQGLGGDNENLAGTGGQGTGGKVTIRANGGEIDLQGGGFARSLGTGGQGFTGGTGTGGAAQVDATKRQPASEQFLRQAEEAIAQVYTRADAARLNEIAARFAERVEDGKRLLLTGVAREV